MIKILFICLGNICRSPLAEFYFKDLVAKHNLSAEFYIESAATSYEETGNPVHPGTRKKLAAYICRMDFVLADMMNMKLVRTGTIAEGASYCDFRYSRKK